MVASFVHNLLLVLSCSFKLLYFCSHDEIRLYMFACQLLPFCLIFIWELERL